MTSSAVPSMFPIFAQEIFDEIMDHTTDCSQTLKICSLVCRSWLPRARTHLFHDFTFPPKNPEEGVDYMDEIQKALQLLVDDMNNSTLVPPLSRIVRRLRISRTEWWDCDNTYLQVLPHAFLAQLPFKNLTHIRVHGAKIDRDGSEAFCNLLEKQHLLESLVFDDIFSASNYFEIYRTVARDGSRLHTFSFPMAKSGGKEVIPPEKLPRLLAFKLSRATVFNKLLLSGPFLIYRHLIH
ncbi:hypothetical protein VKT23_015952 [Stygiomarasmius scandens]|uniref:F-box domain-containing protein n=1 Tax=Marasmiellus scandens TaxID=2682957 RepID=A0ABR1IYH8_9AGAR